MTLLLQISDLHFGTEQAAVVQALRALALAQKPDALLISGDITQRARASQFAEARAFCHSLGIRQQIALPGNHDISLLNVFGRLVDPYRDYLRHFGPSLEGRLELPGACVVSVKTTRRWRHKNGEVSSAQIARVVAELKKSANDQLRVVMVHQPIQVVREGDAHDRLRGWEAALAAWADAGADVVMGGHIHLPYVTEMSTTLPHLGRRVWCVQAGTALSSRVRWEAPNSVNILRKIQSLAWQVERWDFIATSGAFELVKAQQMVLDRPGPPVAGAPSQS